MIPHELRATVRPLPADGDRSMVVITGPSLGDQRCAYRLQQEFGDLVRAWFQLAPASVEPPAVRGQRFSPNPLRLVRLAKSALRKGHARRLPSQRARNVALAQQRLFSAEVEELRRSAKLTPAPVAATDDPGFIEAVRALNPCLVLLCGGALLPRQLLESIRGPAITLQTGWSPRYMGSTAFERALYHRDLNGIGATVHLLTSAGELGPIIRRSHPCLVPWEGPEACLSRVIALGTELMCEVAQEIIHGRELVVYELPVEPAISPPAAPLDDKMLGMIYSDFSRGWLATALQQARQF
jgi:folate-dependent phosphoribosylglycinamide formyltransferase PurN